MAKLSKAEAKQHAAACRILEKDVLTWDDKFFVLENWREDANHVNGTVGAFFTPPGLARDFAIDAGGGKVIDLCAGIGGLAFAVWARTEWEHRSGDWEEQQKKITCVELNPAYCEVGKKILPHARWICGSVFDLPDDVGSFDTAISNPPFGAVKHEGKASRYTGKDFEYKVIDIASDLADHGCFILPQMSSPFRLSGQRDFQDSREGRFGNIPRNEKYERFAEITKIDLEPGCGIDTSYYLGGWHGVKPLCEVVTVDFVQARQNRQQPQSAALLIERPVTSSADQLALF